jgi:glycosyltransferase involved in cell wall biosynthesis
MYFLPIHVPIYLRGGEHLLATDWKRSLELLRDSFSGRYGRIRVVAPTVDADAESADQQLESVSASDEIDLFPSFPLHTRARAFWTKYVHVWRRDVAVHVPDADVVHAGFDDVYRPMNFIAFLMGHHANKPTVFVQDTDHVLQQRELARGQSLRTRVKAGMYSEAYELAVRKGVSYASLSLLKGQSLIDRYGEYAKNAKNFHDTSFFTHEVISRPRLDARVSGLHDPERSLRLVYCGRLEPRKGLRDSIEAVAQARARGARVTFDVIGDGMERGELEQQAEHLGLRESVRFLGSRVYGKELLTDLASYDAVLFTPQAEDTPRMIFDGYAAGLPLLGYSIPYVLERELEDGAAISSTRDPQSAASLLVTLDSDRDRLAKLALRAREAALYHAADAWYRRRAEWTDEAVRHHNSALDWSPGPAGRPAPNG